MSSSYNLFHTLQQILAFNSLSKGQGLLIVAPKPRTKHQYKYHITSLVRESDGELPVPGLPRKAIWGGLLSAIFKPRDLRFSSQSIPLAHLRNCILSSRSPTICDIASSNSSIAFASRHDSRAFLFLCSSICRLRSLRNLSVSGPPKI